ncbi:MAG: TatD family nuclease-associated radical SAM protein [Desulfotomaculaceae bacterium]|nr:TatD family nuclease-associated radical SAM protein [Desulfotomaculaceae bacterium]
MAGNVYAYTIGDTLYLNITNRCTNDCVFCIRRTKEGVCYYDLWLEKEPSLDELLEAAGDVRRYREVVFCGYGEPLIRIDLVVEAARALQSQGVPVRINTNGQAGLYHGRNIAAELAGLIDVVSISLNAADSGQYATLCQPQQGEKAFPAILEFAGQCKKYIPQVILSVVRWPGVDIDGCREIARTLDVELRVREPDGTFTSS